jgi:predicted GIY-YIG superfamily endonuclease
MDQNHNHYCYIINHPFRNQWTYNGYTVNIKRRLRQHNGELVGGARYTTKKNEKDGSWTYLIIVHSPEFDHRRALSWEWHTRYPNNKRPRPSEFQGPMGRLKGQALVFENPKFHDITKFNVWVHDEYYEVFRNLILQHVDNARVTLKPLSDFVHEMRPE